MSGNGGYTNDLVLLNSVQLQAIFPLGLVQTATAKPVIPLDAGQSITYARIFCQISVPLHLAGAVATVTFNGNNLGNINLPTDLGGNDTEYLGGSTAGIEVTDFMDPKGNNVLVVSCDALSADLTFTVYADIYYELNTSQAPSTDPTLTTPSNNNNSNSASPLNLWQWLGLPKAPTWTEVEPYVAVGALVVGGLIIGPPIIRAIFATPTPKCKGPLCGIFQ